LLDKLKNTVIARSFSSEESRQMDLFWG